MTIGITGAGAMGSGMAQVAATAGHEVRLYDISPEAGQKALDNIIQSTSKLATKGILTHEEAKAITGRIYLCDKLETLSDCSLIIEAVIEDVAVKKDLFARLEKILTSEAVLATNTSSLSVTSIASTLQKPDRFIGIHFFNPPVLMKLVEVIPALQTHTSVTDTVCNIITSWGKEVVLAKDTPGFIVNKVARPYYSEAIRIMEEGIADMETIDASMVEHGFKMGPFALMDFIGHDVNYRVTESVWKGFYYDPRYRPSFSQLRLLEAGWLGRKSGKGFYTYPKSEAVPSENRMSHAIFMRIFSMLVNEAADTVGMDICTEADVEKAMTLGVNYPEGLLAWGKKLGYGTVVAQLDDLFGTYHEERYRVCRYIRQLAKKE